MTALLKSVRLVESVAADSTDIRIDDFLFDLKGLGNVHEIGDGALYFVNGS